LLQTIVNASLTANKSVPERLQRQVDIGDESDVRQVGGRVRVVAIEQLNVKVPCDLGLREENENDSKEWLNLSRSAGRVGSRVRFLVVDLENCTMNNLAINLDHLRTA